jgi:hypothetical protein
MSEENKYTANTIQKESKKSTSRYLYAAGDQIKNIEDHWITFEQNLPRIIYEINHARIYKNAGTIHMNILKDINTLMPPNISLSYSFGEINGIPLPEVENRIEFYLSPNCNKDSLNDLDILYKSFPQRLRKYEIDVFKYRAFNKHNISREISGLPKNLRLLYKKLLFMPIDGRSEDNKPILHIIVFFDDKNEDVSSMFQQREIAFSTGEKRKTWVCDNIAPLYVAIIGEENFMHNIGYIEYLPLSECKSEEVEPISSLINNMEYIKNIQGIKECAVCYRSQRQAALKRCGKCKKTLYCGEVCQSINYNSHKVICKEAA